MEQLNGRGSRRSVNYMGYMMLYLSEHPAANPNGYAFEHVIKAERALGRRLPQNARVHHMNGVRSDNATPCNLILCENQGYHLLLHQRMRAFAACGNASARKCHFCKKWDEEVFKPKIGTPYHRRCAAESKQRRLGRIA